MMIVMVPIMTISMVQMKMMILMVMIMLMQDPDGIRQGHMDHEEIHCCKDYYVDQTQTGRMMMIMMMMLAMLMMTMSRMSARTGVNCSVSMLEERSTLYSGENLPNMYSGENLIKLHI